MFMNDFHVEQSSVELSLDDTVTAGGMVDSTDYEALLNTVDAARNGLVSGEHDYDLVEDDIV